jgi:hypothetical protein
VSQFNLHLAGTVTTFKVDFGKFAGLRRRYLMFWIVLIEFHFHCTPQGYEFRKL